MIENFKTVSNSSKGEFKDRGSKFIAYCYAVSSLEDVSKNILIVKKAHQKASHHCYAYRIGIDKNNFRANDDGEPSGTGGKPILGQIDSFGITNVLIIVVRYFGGVLLGAGGLINAYREAAKEALNKATIVERKLTYEAKLNCDFIHLPEVMNLLKRLHLKILNSDFTEGCEINIIADKEQLKKLTDLRELKIELKNQV